MPDHHADLPCERCAGRGRTDDDGEGRECRACGRTGRRPAFDLADLADRLGDRFPLPSDVVAAARRAGVRVGRVRVAPTAVETWAGVLRAAEQGAARADGRPLLVEDLAALLDDAPAPPRRPPVPDDHGARATLRAAFSASPEPPDDATLAADFDAALDAGLAAVGVVDERAFLGELIESARSGVGPGMLAVRVARRLGWTDEQCAELAASIHAEWRG